MDTQKPDLSELITRLESLASSEKSADERVVDCFNLIVESMKPERGFMLLIDPESNGPRALAGYHVDLESLLTTEEISQTIINVVLEDENPLLTTDAMEDPRFSVKVSVLLSGIRSVICIPLSSEKGIFGLIYMDNRVARGFYTVADRDYLIACAAKLSAIIVGLYPDLVYRKRA